ncbi:hypothetical protein HQ865_12580 [Mucilaginibacter mali]|uniref:Uncharacterized protein n=1 Tax=Mucilaginibacter mali TaxID=2740462 RepID=A0A7D4UBA2_9SPHI|nr:hypothetical protein [Mucilaginibacter mali]QKJ30558.1 hypothetical protein HQ865_12580 [Mucilaginibacter mali]
MNNENKGPRNAGAEQWIRVPDENTSPDANNKSGSLETRGPDKSKPFNVLNQDGSLADLPDENVEGKGALDGTVGLGT